MTLARARSASALAANVGGVFAARLRRAASPRMSGPLPAWNLMFDDMLPERLEAERDALAAFDVYLYRMLNDPRLLGQIAFEYGVLVNAVPAWTGLRVLDVGTGRSTFPRWMASRGASVVTFDFPEPVESAIGGWLGRVDGWLAWPHRRLDDVRGSLETLPFASGSADLVTCLSVLEHLDTRLPDRTYVPPGQQAARLGAALAEMVRVLRPGGLLYITSECCDFSRASADAWRGAYYYREGPPLSAAWPVEQVPALFHHTLRQLGCEPVGPVLLDPAAIGHTGAWTWRGPYFSAFSLLFRKQS